MKLLFRPSQPVLPQGRDRARREGAPIRAGDGAVHPGGGLRAEASRTCWRPIPRARSRCWSTATSPCSIRRSSSNISRMPIRRRRSTRRAPKRAGPLPPARALADEILLPLLRSADVPQRRRPTPTRAPAAARETEAARAEAAISVFYAGLEAKLGRPRLFCGGFSVADIAMFMTVLFVLRLRGPRLAGFPVLPPGMPGSARAPRPQRPRRRSPPPIASSRRSAERLPFTARQARAAARPEPLLNAVAQISI